MARKSILLLVNPEFDKRFDNGISRLYSVFCREHNYNLEIIDLETLKEFQPDNEHQQIIIIAGGDGTIHQAINAVPTEYFDKYLWGIIPAGTANEFAKSLNIPISLIKSAELVANPKKIQVQNIGIINNEIRFTTGLLYGVASHVLLRTPKLAKHILGNAAFYFGFLNFYLQFWSSRNALIKEFTLNDRKFRTNYLLINNVSLSSKNLRKKNLLGEEKDKFSVIYIHSRLRALKVLNLMLRELIHDHILQDPALYWGQAKTIILKFNDKLDFLIDGDMYSFSSPINIAYFDKPMYVICA